MERAAKSVKLPRPLAKRGEIGSFIAMDVMRTANELEAAGKDIIHMEVGQPATRAPAKVIAAARKALYNERLGYTDALGLPALRERIARHYRDTYGVAISPGRVVVTTGSSAGFVLVFLAILDTGGRIALPSPSYPAYRNIMRALGVKAVTLESGPGTRWMPTGSDLEAAARTGALDGILIASPANPTGTMLVGDSLGQLAAAAGNMKLWLISDEIYHGLDFTEPAQTALQHCDAAIVVNSFSKYYAMTGWRIGWMVVPEELVRTIERLAQNFYISPPAVSQHAALAAFDSTDELEAIKAGYIENRSLLLEELPRLGFNEILPADGAFYLYANVRYLTNDSVKFAHRLLTESGVAVTPGVDFDSARGSHFVRFSYSGDYEDMTKALERIGAWMA